ncbi:MAG: hypothetical protein SVK08_01255 [Halobacteriota archaeon]|nr:hypothetical protein [Halobacteriota archaeon]
MAEFEDKYIVIKISDYEKYKKEAQEEKYEDGEFRLGRKSKNIHSFEEMLTEFDNQNEYVVINLDEPYANAVVDIVIAFENLKEKMINLGEPYTITVAYEYPNEKIHKSTLSFSVPDNFFDEDLSDE